MTRELTENHRKTLKEVDELRRRINELELSISNKGQDRTKEDEDQLNSALDMLNRLSDSLILESGRAWEEYNKLEHDCKTSAFDHARLDDLRDVCKKTEEFAADLLCYSLARFKRKDS
jgi:hypothetical protein